MCTGEFAECVFGVANTDCAHFLHSAETIINARESGFVGREVEVSEAMSHELDLLIVMLRIRMGSLHLKDLGRAAFYMSIGSV